MNHRRPEGPRLLPIVLFMLASLAGAALAGTIDPLLTTLQAQRAGKAEPGPADLDLTRLLAVESGGRYDDPVVGVIMDLDPTAAVPDGVAGLVVGSRHGALATGRLPLSSVAQLAAQPGVRHVQASRRLWPTLDAAVPAGRVDQVWAGTPAYTGDGVLVGVIDSGIDWRHADFALAAGPTRIAAIWDQWSVVGVPPDGFPYGAEYTAAAIDAGTAGERDFSGHGTHVAGIAAGNGLTSSGLYRGVAYEADILVAKSWSDQDQIFFEDRVMDAMNYLVQKAASRGQPIVINMSLGGHLGPHDGTQPQEQLIDQLSGEGVVFCVAAGNEGESSIHDQAPASSGTLTYRIVSYTPNAGEFNDYAYVIIWVEGAVSPSVTVQGGGMTVGPVAGGFLDRASGVGGTVAVDNASGGADPNGNRLIVVEFDDRAGTPPAADDWTITLAAGTGTAHAWHVTSTMTAGWPDSDQRYSVGMPASAESAITVGALKTRQSWPSLVGEMQYNPDGTWGQTPLGARAPFSSIGPTRDGRQKPDITAPGMAVVSCYSEDTDPRAHDQLLVGGGRYLATQGTSMAAPFAAGVVALMLEKNPALTAAEVRSILRETAVADGQTGPTWNEYFGAGKLDALAALAAVPGDGAASGDIDGDGRVTVLDLVSLVNHILDPVGSPLEGDAREAADAFPAPAGDGLLDAQDLALLIAFVLAEDDPAPMPAAAPVLVTVGEVSDDADGRWVPITVTGEAVAAGQLVLRCPGAGWPAGPLGVLAPGGVTARAQVVGDEVRLMFFSLDAMPFVAGVTLRVPLPATAPSDLPEATASGVLVAAPGGERRPTSVIAGVLPRLLLAAGPSPTAGPATIRYGLAGQAATVDLAVYDLRGRRVRRLHHDRQATEGGVVAWDGRDDAGQPLASGIYLVRLVADREVVTRKVVLRR